MVLSIVLLKFLEWLLCHLVAKSCYRVATKLRNNVFFLKHSPSSSRSSQPNLFSNLTKCDLNSREKHVLVCDIHGTLLRSQSFFPYFMLVCFEGGGIVRAALLLVSYPLLLVMSHDVRLRVMVFITFCGLKLKGMESVARAVLPKFYLERLNLQTYQLLASCGRKVVFTSVPRVMVEGFLKEYLKVNVVVGTELESLGGYFTGFLSEGGLLVKHRALKELFGENKPDIGIGSSSSLDDHLFISLCKEAYIVSKADSKHNTTSVLPRSKYPKPLVFHDGRLAFFPTPLATFAMFLWLPLGITLAIFRLLVGILLPYQISNIVGCWSGVVIKVKGNMPPNKIQQPHALYVCTHRTLMDPVFLSTSLRKPLTAVTYSLSKMSELMAPIKTVRLTRDRQQDGKTMERLLKEGDLVVCPEGTTCREPYLLRFSALFAELTDEIIPVAINTHVSMFYGTTASGLKCLDPIFFLMNPKPSYYVEILDKVPKEMTCSGGKSSCEVANYIQRKLADALGFECTTLTRRDKYLMLAGNEGVVEEKKKKEKKLSHLITVRKEKMINNDED